MELNQIGAELRELRLQRGMSQGDVERAAFCAAISRGLRMGMERRHWMCCSAWLGAMNATPFEFFNDGAPEAVSLSPELPAADAEFLKEIACLTRKLDLRDRTTLLAMVKRFAGWPKESATQ